MSKIRITVDFTVLDADTNEQVVDMKTLTNLAMETAEDMRSRLFGAGFLPGEFIVGSHQIIPGVIDLV